MKERPILFNSEMVRAILEDRKVQTRRVVKPTVVDNGPTWSWEPRAPGNPSIIVPKHFKTSVTMPKYCPYGQPGDRLWVRETHAIYGDKEKFVAHYRADRDNWPDDCGWKPSIHMPRWASRITLEVTGVRVERLQEISVGDLWAESFREPGGLEDFKTFFDWSSNPWVWVVEFRRVDA